MHEVISVKTPPNCNLERKIVVKRREEEGGETIIQIYYLWGKNLFAIKGEKIN